MMSVLRILAIGAAAAAIVGCNAQQQYRQQSSINESVVITLPDGFNRQSDLSTAISKAVAQATLQKGVTGNAYWDDGFPRINASTTAPSADPYLAALSDAQTHAAQIAKATGLTLGRITRVREQRGGPPYQPQNANQILLEVDFGDALTVYGSAPLATPQRFGGPTSSMTVRIMGTGANASDALSSAAAFENAVRSALAPFGIKPGSAQVQSGSVNSAQ